MVRITKHHKVLGAGKRHNAMEFEYAITVVVVYEDVKD